MKPGPAAQLTQRKMSYLGARIVRAACWADEPFRRSWPGLVPTVRCLPPAHSLHLFPFTQASGDLTGSVDKLLSLEKKARLVSSDNANAIERRSGLLLLRQPPTFVCTFFLPFVGW
jgi:hypothetical protein